MSTGRVINIRSDSDRWHKHRRGAFATIPAMKPHEPDYHITTIDLTPPPDPVEDVKRLSTLDQAAAYAGCRPGAITVYDPKDRSITVCPVRCKKWTCPTCGPILARIWAKRIADARPQRMITLTCDHKRFPRPDLAYDEMKEALPRLVRLIRQQIGPIEYAAVWELHEDGYPHLHLAVRGHYIPQKWLSLVWDNLGVGPIVDIRKVKTGKGAALYMSKYMTKTVTAGKDALQLTRVIQSSKHYFEKTILSYKSYVPPGGKAELCRGDPYRIVKHLVDHCNYKPDGTRPGPPWRFIPDHDVAHSRPPDDVLYELSTC